MNFSEYILIHAEEPDYSCHRKESVLMNAVRPDIFTYNNYRLFLKDLFHFCKSQDSKYSHRFVAKEVSASSCGWFSDIINGRINLTSKYGIKLARLFRFTEKQRDYFETLVAYDQSASFEEKEMHYRKLLSFNNNIKATMIRKDQFTFYSKWFIPAIRELLFIFDFKDDYRALSRKMNPPISTKEAKKAIEVLLSCNLIQKNALGFYKPKDTFVEKDSSFGSLYWALFMNATVDLAKQSIHNHTKEERDISAVTISLSGEGLDKAREKIKELRKYLLKIAQEDRNQETVYQCNVQLFPLTQMKERNTYAGRHN